MIDKKIKELVEFLNTLPDLKTIGSCQGHDDGGHTGNFDSPYIKFRCHNQKTLGFIASIKRAYENTEDWIEEYKKRKPKLIGLWDVSLEEANDSECIIDLSKDDYVTYLIEPFYSSFDKPSDLYNDFKEILKWYKWKAKRVWRIE